MGKKVLVGMSGGIDSTVAAYLLKKQKYDVTGITMRIFGGNGASGKFAKSACYGPGEESEIQVAAEIAEKIGISHYVIDLENEYKDVVLEYFCNKYIQGQTPNPCIVCNHKIKFGLLLEKARKCGYEFEYFATGHYAKAGYDAGSNRYFIRKGRDSRKDQSYFLYRLSQQQLSAALFPLGDFLKTEVMEIAREVGFENVASKPQSQDFYGGDDLSVLFTGKNITGGEIVDLTGNVIGRHSGIIHYTIGQRRGLNLGGMTRPLYVVDINARKNQIVVGSRDDLFSRDLLAIDLNWQAVPGLDKSLRAKAKIRFQQFEQDCTIVPFSPDRIGVTFTEPQLAVTPGQSIVLYEKDIVIGGGIIQRASAQQETA